jgi:hypothetical protein
MIAVATCCWIALRPSVVLVVVLVMTDSSE